MTAVIPKGSFTTTHDCGFFAVRTTEALAAEALRRHSCVVERTYAGKVLRDEEGGRVVDCSCPTVRHEHGTREAYNSDRCRCVRCKKANNQAAAARSRARAYGRLEAIRIDGAAMRDHIEELLAGGMVLGQIAQAAGVSRSALKYARSATPRDGVLCYPKPTKSIVKKVLAVRADTMSPAFVDATGTRRRLQALMRIGYSKTQLGPLLNLGTPLLALMGQTRVTSATANKTKTGYDILWKVPPPQTTRAERHSFSLAVNAAKAAGYAPPLAWDDDTIDDPSAQPEGVATALADRRGMAAADRAEDTEHLLDQGLGMFQILDRFGTTREGLYKALARADRRDLCERLRSTIPEERAAAA